MRLKGPARSIDVSLLLQEQRRLRKKISGTSVYLKILVGLGWVFGGSFVRTELKEHVVYTFAAQFRVLH